MHGVVRWRRVDLQQIVAERFGVAYHERTIGKILKQLGFSYVSAFPRHPAKDGRPWRLLKTYGPPRPQAAFASDLTGLRQRIRSRGRAPAKMEFRAPLALIRLTARAPYFKPGFQGADQPSGHLASTARRHR